MGRPPPAEALMTAPSCPRVSRSGRRGRRRNWSDPSKVNAPDPPAAKGGRKRAAVPASTQSTLPLPTGPRPAPVTIQVSGDEVSTAYPRAAKPPAKARVSSLMRGASNCDCPWLIAARASTLFVMLFDPGIRTPTLIRASYRPPCGRNPGHPMDSGVPKAVRQSYRHSGPGLRQTIGRGS